MLSFGTLFLKICIEGFIPVADILCCIVKGISEISGAPFFHVGMTVIQLSGLVCRRRHPRIGQYLICGIKTTEITYFSNNHCPHPVSDTGNGKDRKLDFFVHDQLDGCFNRLSRTLSSHQTSA